MVIFENIILVYIDKAILDKATDSWMYVLMLDQQILCLAVYKLGLAKLVLPNIMRMPSNQYLAMVSTDGKSLQNTIGFRDNLCWIANAQSRRCLEGKAR